MTLNSLLLVAIPQHLHQKSSAHSKNKNLAAHLWKKSPEAFHYNFRGSVRRFKRCCEFLRHAVMYFLQLTL